MNQTLIDTILGATEILKDRSARYGDNVLVRTAQLASLKLDQELSPYVVAIVLESLKDARRTIEPHESEHYTDGMNYRALASVYRPGAPTPVPPKRSNGQMAASLDEDVAKRIALSENELDVE